MGLPSVPLASAARVIAVVLQRYGIMDGNTSEDGRVRAREGEVSGCRLWARSFLC